MKNIICLKVINTVGEKTTLWDIFLIVFNTEFSRYEQADGTQGAITLLSQYATIVQAEMIGIKAAAQLTIWERCRRRLHICSDSVAVLTLHAYGSALTLQCRNRFSSLAKVRAVDLICIPKQCGIRNKETEDYLGSLEAKQALINPEPTVYLP